MRKTYIVPVFRETHIKHYVEAESLKDAVNHILEAEDNGSRELYHHDDILDGETLDSEGLSIYNEGLSEEEIERAISNE